MNEALPSPCTRVCQIDVATGWCQGCARSLQEIAVWGSAPVAVQRDILNQLPARQQQLHRHGLWLGPHTQAST